MVNVGDYTSLMIWYFLSKNPPGKKKSGKKTRPLVFVRWTFLFFRQDFVPRDFICDSEVPMR